MNFIVNNEHQLENIVTYLKNNAVYPFNLSYEFIKQQKTYSQCKYVFGGLAKLLINYYFDTQGESWSVDEIKTMLYNATGLVGVKLLPNGDEGVSVKTLSMMTKQEASEFINNSLVWIELNHPDCIIPPELRNCWLLHITDDDIERAWAFDMPMRSATYLSYVRKQSCLCCGKPVCEAHHVKLRKYSSLSQKPPDWLAIPLCNDCHIAKVHWQGQNHIIKVLHTYKTDIELYCRLSYMRWLYKKY